MTPYGSIYVAVNQLNNKCYVGQTTRTVEKRWRAHIKSGSTTYFTRELRRVGAKVFSVSTIAEAQNKEQLDQLEKLWIITLNSMDSTHGYNTRMGGAHGTFSDEIKAQLRLTALGRKHTPETKEKLRVAGLGRKHTLGELAKMRASNLGKRHTEETKQKIRVHLTGNSNAAGSREALC
jgi:group I intron endonuclease